MAASSYPVAIHTCARADGPDMGARAHAMLSNMRADPDSQNVYVRAEGIGRNWREKCEYEEGRSEGFHLVISCVDRCNNAWPPLKVQAMIRPSSPIQK